MQNNVNLIDLTSVFPRVFYRTIGVEKVENELPTISPTFRVTNSRCLGKKSPLVGAVRLRTRVCRQPSVQVSGLEVNEVNFAARPV